MKKTKIVLLIGLLTILILVSTVSADDTLSGIIAYYPFDTTANDVVGTYHGTVFGATQTAGIKGNAFYFDGINDYIYVPRSVSDDFSIIFWVNTTQTAATNIPGVDPNQWNTHQWWVGNGLVDAEIDTEMDDFGTSLLGSKASFGKGDQTLHKDFTIESTSDINDGKWHQIAAVRKISNGEMKLYVDGILEADRNRNI